MSIRLENEILDQLIGYMHGEPEELTKKFREMLHAILASRKPNAIKEQLPRLVKFVEKIVSESVYCPKCEERESNALGVSVSGTNTNSNEGE